MAHPELLALVVIVAIPLVGIARSAGIPYPIALVLGGLALGFVPGVRVPMDPNVVLLVFLPPLLYWESVTAATDEMRQQTRWIAPLAIGLVGATTVAVAAAAHFAIPTLGWAAAFVLGAVVAPTDEIASIPIAERLGVPRHVTAIIGGEALINDAFSLVLYATAVGAVAAGTFSLGGAALGLVGSVAGAVAIGLVVARLAVLAWRRFGDPELQIVVSVLAPFAAYVPANAVHASGVLAVVVAGVSVNRWSPVVLRPATRLQGVGWWETTVFLLNVVLYMELGMQLHAIVVRAEARHGWGQLLLWAALVNVVVVGLRFAWVFAQAALPGMGGQHGGRADPKHVAVIAMGGLRGAISLAAALGIPVAVAGGGFPERDLIVFLTFSVVLVTLVGGGLVLPYAIAALGVRASPAEERAERRLALRVAAEAALRAIGDAERAREIDGDHARLLRERYERAREQVDGVNDDADARLAVGLARVQSRVLDAQRDAVLALRARGEIDNTVLREVQASLDLQQVRLDRIAEALTAELEPAVTSSPPDGRSAP